MASISMSSPANDAEPVAVNVPGQPQEQLEVEETPDDGEIVFPTGFKVKLAMGAMVMAMFLNGLDMTIVAVTVPSLTNEFRTIEDIGWYSSTYGVFMAAFTFLFGKLYTLYSVKWVFISSIALFELGSLLCTIAQNSPTFIMGRAVAGVGGSGIGSGALVMVAQCFPPHKRPMAIALAATSQSIGLVSSPPIGGALIDGFSWRACFGINLPIGLLVIAITAWGFQDLNTDASRPLSWKEKFKQLDYVGTVLIVPAISLLLLALQWGGIRYGWNDWRIIVSFVSFAVLFSGFGWWQYRLQDRATVPVRVLKQRSILAACWFSACCNGALAVTEYYMAIYFQGIKGFTATKSGVLIVPMIVGLMVAGLLAGAGTTAVGYYAPFMLATTILAPIATGLVTTVDLGDNLIKILCYLGFVGAAIGIGIQAPLNAVNTILPLKDIPIGIAITGFGGGMGSSLFIAASAALFQNRLSAEISQSAPGTNVSDIGHAGLAEIKNIVGESRLRDVLLGYDEAVTQTLYVPVGLACATLLGTIFTEWRSMKKKRT